MDPPKIARGNAGVDLHPSQAELAFTLIRDPISATDWVVCLGAGWRLYHVFTDGLWETGRGTLGSRGRRYQGVLLGTGLRGLQGGARFKKAPVWVQRA